MTALWIAFAALLVPALWLLVLPLRRAGGVAKTLADDEAAARTDRRNVAVYRRRLASLEAARERGEIDDARFEEDRLELERSLLDDTAATRRAALRPARSGRWLVPVVMVALVVASVAGYRWAGAEGDLALYRLHRQAVAGDLTRPELVARLEAEAGRQPDNPQVWRSLYPLYRDGGRIDAADRALTRLIALQGRRPALLAELAQLRYFAGGRALTPEVQALVDEVRAADPSQPTMLGLMGIDAFQHGDYEAAIDRWRRAIAGMNDGESAEALRQGIRTARRRLGRTPEAADGPGLRVRVSLAPELAGRFAPDTAVFVVARDPAGERPPLAVARTTLGALPAELTLDDGDAMAPMARLSQVERARLVARVSASGQAEPQAGDLVGRHAPVAVGEADGAPVELIIDRIVE